MLRSLIRWFVRIVDGFFWVGIAMSWLFSSSEYLLSLLPERRAQSRFILLTRSGLTVYRWSQGIFQDGQSFGKSDLGLAEFAAFLARDCSRAPVFVLVDVIEEELRAEIVPKLLGSNRRELLERRLRRFFRMTPYRRAVSQGEVGEGERILFSGLVNPDLVRPWMDCLLANRTPVVGIWSVQLLGRRLLRMISRRSERALLVSLHSGGLRQTFFLQGRTQISRMTPMVMQDQDALLVAIRSELLKTRGYLQSLRILHAGVSFDLFFVAYGDLPIRLGEKLDLLEGVCYQPVDSDLLGNKMGLKSGVYASIPELLYGQLLLRRPPRYHYGRPEELQFRPNHVTARLRLLVAPWLTRNSSSSQKIHNADCPLPRRRLGDVLIERGMLSPDGLQAALVEQKRTQDSLGSVLVKMGLVEEANMRDVLAAILNYDSIDLTDAFPDPAAVKRVPKAFALRHGILPILWNDAARNLVVAMSNPLNVSVLDLLGARLEPGSSVLPKLAGETEIAEAMDRFYGHELSVDGILQELDTGEVAKDGFIDVADSFSHPMVRLLDALLTDAVKKDASDIHIGPTAGFIRVRYRIDGVLHRIYSMHRDLLPNLMVRIKVMAGLNIAETRIPQDGRLAISVSGRIVNFRVSIQPTISGENAVFRVLDLRKEVRDLGELGLTTTSLVELNRALSRYTGLVLVTGPTGSGKTTTLYSMLNHVSSEGLNIMTMEDPVEYPMPTILQTHVNKAVGLDYAAGIRSMLWQDPDVILVGEVHDRETANMALQAAMTGHQVLTTLHASSAFGAIPRLLNLGASRDFIAGNINCIIAQRLIRKLCPECRIPARPTEPERTVLSLQDNDQARVYRAVGCASCFGSGYRGRMPIMEILPVNDAFDDLVCRGESRGAFLDLIRLRGFRTMADDGIEWILAGKTTMEEVARVVNIDALLPAE
ncbi:MAG: GspE/PulE family protein [Magnetococcus sp. XQGC-1]